MKYILNKYIPKIHCNYHLKVSTQQQEDSRWTASVISIPYAY